MINLKWRREITWRGDPAEILACKHGYIEVEATVITTMEGNLSLAHARYKSLNGKDWEQVRNSGPFWRDLENAVTVFSRERAGLMESLGEKV